MNAVKPIAATVLLVVGGLCLGRALETGLDSNPDRLNQRETVTAGVLLGLPAVVGGGWLWVDGRRQRQQAEQQRLRTAFFQLVRAGRGKVTPLRFAMEAQISGDRANAFLRDRAREYDATFQVDAEGGITYCFHLGDIDSRLLPTHTALAFDVVLEFVPPSQPNLVGVLQPPENQSRQTPIGRER